MIRSSLAVVLIAVTIAACGGDATEVVTPTRIDITPTVPQLYAGDTIRFSATVRDAHGAAISTARVRWSSQDTTRVRIDSGGLATVVFTPAQATPPVVITASYGTLTGSTTVGFLFRGALNLWPDTNVLVVGASRTLVSRAINAIRSYPSPDVVAIPVRTWTTSDPSVATVDSIGSVVAKATGHVHITGSLPDGRSAIAEVYVVAGPSSPLHFVSVSGGLATVKSEPTFGDYYDSHGCGLTAAGEVYCWGAALDATGPTDRCELTYRSSPGSYSLFWFRCSEAPYRLQSPVTFTSLAARGDVGCGVATTKKIYCWGTNTGGELGLGTTDSLRHGVAQIASSDDFISVHVPETPTSIGGGGSAFPCGLRTDRVLVCWGSVIGPTPKALTGTTWQTIADASRCGIATDSSAYCFTTGVAQRVGGSAHWASIATGANPVVCATDAAGVASCGSITSFPSGVAGPQTYSLVGTYSGSSLSGSTSVCGLSSGDVYCFNNSPPKAADIGGVKLKRFFATCGLASNDKVYCWTRDPTLTGYAFRLIPGQ